jgi:starch phosphorylase
LAQWKETVAERWDAIRVVKAEWTYPVAGIETAQKYTIRYVIDEQGLEDAVALEKVNVYINKEGEEKIFSIEPLKVVGHEGNNYTFEATLAPQQAGQFKSAIRMYPKHKELPHRQDFCYIKWLELPNANV